MRPTLQDILSSGIEFCTYFFKKWNWKLKKKERIHVIIFVFSILKRVPWKYFDRSGNSYSEFFGVADYESEVGIPKFKMADPIVSQVHAFSWNFNNFARICLGTFIRGVSKSLIENLKSESTDWNGGPNMIGDLLVNLKEFCSNSLRNGYSGVFCGHLLRIWK